MCGIVGVHGHDRAVELTLRGLESLVHRGGFGSGIAREHEGVHVVTKGLGSPQTVFGGLDLAEKTDRYVIGHNRYPTSGARSEDTNGEENLQPLNAVVTGIGPVSIAHNGNLTNTRMLRETLLRWEVSETASDTHLILGLLANAEGTLEQRVWSTLMHLQGAFSLVILAGKTLIAARDAHGVRPLVLGNREGATIVASEKIALLRMGATYERDIEPGEILIVNEEGKRSVGLPSASRHACIFEKIYFAQLYGDRTAAFRMALGERLAERCPVDADIVVPVLRSGGPAAEGFAQASGIPYRTALMRVGGSDRSFLQPTQDARDRVAAEKHVSIPDLCDGQRIALVDDSIVRGTTMRRLVEVLRAAGAREVHVFSSAPKVIGSCYYGIDTPTPGELIARRLQTDKAIATELGADSVHFLPLEDLRGIAQEFGHTGICVACFSGQYPIPVE